MGVRPLSPTAIELPVNGVWVIDVAVTDSDGGLVDVTPEVTVTLPGGTTATPTVEAVAAGYRAEYVVGTAGRYIARAVTPVNGAADFAAYASATVAAGDMPDLADVLNYLQWEEDNEYGDAAEALATESDAQRRVCRVGAVYPRDLRHALYRRVARSLGMKGIPLAVLRGDAESGSATFLPGRDPEVRRLEAPHRKLVMG